MSLLRTYDEAKEDQPCEICEKIDERGILCDWCDKAYHKECLGDKYREFNPVSWFCPACHVEMLATNERDPYTDHNFLRYLADPDSLGNEVSK